MWKSFYDPLACKMGIKIGIQTIKLAIIVNQRNLSDGYLWLMHFDVDSSNLPRISINQQKVFFRLPEKFLNYYGFCNNLRSMAWLDADRAWKFVVC